MGKEMEIVTRTGEFRVTDEARYMELYAGLSCEGGVWDFSRTDSGGKTVHSFGAYGDISYRDGGCQEFIKELRTILDGAFTLFVTGHKGMREVAGWVLVATPGGVRDMSLDGWAGLAALEMLSQEAACKGSGAPAA